MRTRPYSLAVIAFDEMDLLDVAAPLEVFSTAGRQWNWRAIKAELLAEEPKTLGTRSQLSIGPARSFDAAPEPELILIPGGYGARRALECEPLIAFLKRSATGTSLILTVGLGALIAARAGLLAGCPVACQPTLAPELLALDATLLPRTEPGVVKSERALSVARGGAALELGLEVVALLLGKSQALGTARELGYAWGIETLSIELGPGPEPHQG